MADRTIETDQGTIAYSADGAGEVLLLLAGFQSDRNGWIRSGYPELLENYRVLSVDPLGHGLSSKPHDKLVYSAQDVAGHVQAVLDDDSVDKAHIWGFSRGGQIAAVCSELIPERCASAIMGGTPLGAAWGESLSLLLKGEPYLADGDWDSYWDLFPVPIPQPLIDHFTATNDPRALAAIIRAMPQWRTDLPNFGLNDGPVPRFAYYGTGEVFADTLRDVLADSPIEAHEGSWAGHAETMVDAPGVVSAVEQFLKTQRET